MFTPGIVNDWKYFVYHKTAKKKILQLSTATKKEFKMFALQCVTNLIGSFILFQNVSKVRNERSVPMWYFKNNRTFLCLLCCPMNICFLFQVQSAKYTLGLCSILAIFFCKNMFSRPSKKFLLKTKQYG